MGDNPRDVSAAGKPRLIRFGPFRFDRHGLLLSSNGSPLPVPPKALLVLRCLVDRAGEVVLKDELMQLVWDDAIVTESSLAEAIRILRQALGDDPRSPSYIETIHRRGYRFRAEIAEGDEDPQRRTAGAAPADAERGESPAVTGGSGDRARLLRFIAAAVAVVVLLSMASCAVVMVTLMRDAGGGDASVEDGLANVIVDADDPVARGWLYAGASGRFEWDNDVYRYEVSEAGDARLDMTLTHPDFDQPCCFAYDPSSDELLVVNRRASGGALFRFLDPGATPLPNGQITAPEFVTPHWATFSNQVLYVANMHWSAPLYESDGGDLLALSIDGSGSFVLQGPPLTDRIDGWVRGVAVDPGTGELFVTRCCAASQIERYLFDADGGATHNGSITEGLDNPHDLAFSPWGELFVVNYGNGTVARFIIDGTGDATPNGVVAAEAMDGVIGLTFSSWGELFVARTYGSGGIFRWRFDESGNAVYNGSFVTPGGVSDVEFVPVSVR